MKSGIQPRKTAKRVITRRLGQPSIRQAEDGTPVFILRYVDTNGYLHYQPATKEVCKVVADTSGEGEVPNGLDILQDHLFVLHHDAQDTIVGIDIVPAKKYTSNTVPLTLVGVEDVQLQYQNGGVVCRVLRRATKIAPEDVITAIRHLDDVLTSGNELEVGMRVGDGSIADILNGVITLKLPLRKTTKRNEGIAEQLLQA